METDYTKKFNDALASTTSWEPLRKGGASFKTYNLISKSPAKIKFRPTWYAILFYVIFMGIGSGFIISNFYDVYINNFNFAYFSFFNFAIGIIFLIVGVILAINNIKPITFDKTLGYYWMGYRKPNYNSAYKKPDVFFRIIDIYALQLISEYIKGNKNSYYSYELNIVFRDTSRKNIVDHGDIEELRQDAEKLSSFINRPLWSDTGKS